jgi:uncharacterized protein YPO0396
MSEVILSSVEDIRRTLELVKAKIFLLQDDLKNAQEEIARLKARPTILQQMQQLKFDQTDISSLRLNLKQKIDSLEPLVLVGSPETTTSTGYDTTELKELLLDLNLFIVAKGPPP